ncbi:hypothetical protein V496_00592 [Pseudogymnoascus sp. VKM F-4515 (FW-2607)]|nr:hypothetical protein V496_00592 [Pseudogymnoascus sp. VKM F-4515 (FW-2607)]
MLDAPYRIVLLGETGVGKTALSIQMYDYDPTIEDLYRSNVVVDGRPCTLEILDTGGMIYKTNEELRNSWIDSGGGFILVYSISSRDSFVQALKICQQVRNAKETRTSLLSEFGHTTALESSSALVPIVLAGSYCENSTGREVSVQEGYDFAQALGYPNFSPAMQIIQTLNVLFGHYPQANSTSSTISGNKHFSFGAKPVGFNLGGGLSALRGYFRSVRLGTGRMLANINVNHADLRQELAATGEIFKFWLDSPSQKTSTALGPKKGAASTKITSAGYISARFYEEAESKSDGCSDPIRMSKANFKRTVQHPRWASGPLVPASNPLLASFDVGVDLAMITVPGRAQFTRR